MNAKKIALYALGGWLLLKLTRVAQTAAALANFKVSPATFKIHTVTTKGVTIKASLNIDNLSDQDIYLNALMVQIAIGDQYIGSKNIQFRQVIYPFRSFPFQITFTVGFLTMLPLLQAYFSQTSGSLPIPITISGYVVANNTSFPFTNSFTANIPSMSALIDGFKSVYSGVVSTFDASNFTTEIADVKSEVLNPEPNEDAQVSGCRR